MNRREMLLALAAVSTASLVACERTETRSEDANPTPVSDSFFTPEEISQLSFIAQVIIPLTDTAGAIEAGVPRRIDAALSLWHDAETRQNWRLGLERLAASLGGENGWSDFAALDAAAKLDALKPYESSRGGKDPQDIAFFSELKRFVVLAYYTSEAGATEELIYDPVPGDYRGCVPFEEIGRSWATGG